MYLQLCLKNSCIYYSRSCNMTFPSNHGTGEGGSSWGRCLCSLKPKLQSVLAHTTCKKCGSRARVGPALSREALRAHGQGNWRFAEGSVQRLWWSRVSHLSRICIGGSFAVLARTNASASLAAQAATSKQRWSTRSCHCSRCCWQSTIPNNESTVSCWTRCASM